jgi:hypothetical protein
MEYLSSSHNSWRNNPRLVTILQISIILLTGVAAYANSLNGPFHFDDLGISDTAYLWPRAFKSGPRQLVDLTFVFNHLMHGQAPFGYHLINVAVHLAAAIVLFFLCRSALDALSLSFTGSPGKVPDKDQFPNRYLPFAAALLFVCHPVQTQAVTYIVQRYASMAALFYFTSVLTYVQARMAVIRQDPKRHTVTFSFLTLFSAVLALRCKEIAYTLPLMLVVTELFLFRGRLLRNRTFVSCITLILLTIPVVRVFQHGIGGLEDLFFSIRHSTMEELTYSRADYLMTQFRVIATYLRLLIAPVNLNLDYDIPLQKTFLSPVVLSSLTLHLSLLICAFMLFVHSGRLLAERPGGYHGICLRLVSFGIIWFYLTLMVESSFIPILDVIFEHRLYLPSAGGFLAMSASACALATRLPSLRKPLWIFLALVCCALTVATIQRNRVWNDDLLLWEDTARKSPNKPRVLANLTAAYLRANRPQNALPLIIRTLELSPGLTDALNNLGSVLDLLGGYGGRYDNGSRFIVGPRNIDMKHYNQWYANTRNNLGLLYEHSGNLAAARSCYESAVTLSPTFELAWHNLFLTAHRQHDRKMAAEAYQKLHDLSPERARSAALAAQTSP